MKVVAFSSSSARGSNVTMVLSSEIKTKITKLFMYKCNDAKLTNKYSWWQLTLLSTTSITPLINLQLKEKSEENLVDTASMQRICFMFFLSQHV